MERLLDTYHFRDAQKEAMNLARIGNKYLADMEPWKLAKTDMPRVATIMNIALQITANLAIAFEPFLPFSMEKLNKMLNVEPLGMESPRCYGSIGGRSSIGQGRVVVREDRG